MKGVDLKWKKKLQCQHFVEIYFMPTNKMCEDQTEIRLRQVHHLFEFLKNIVKENGPQIDLYYDLRKLIDSPASVKMLRFYV